LAASIKSKFLDGKMSRLADKEEKVKEILDTISIPGRGATMSASIYWRDEFSRLAKVICQLDTEECPECDGKGYRTAEGIYSNWEGTTRQPCERCNSTGRISKSELDKVEIRRGVVEWHNKWLEGHCHDREHSPHTKFRRLCFDCRQAQLKEWGLKP